ncbi:hypothetical protein Pyn_04109 [Prunus yedoensis var. nudiflora]|uniref:Uncharacterized protein n=1 Tax=Prunus yedoensis var. nudiflora TaxID=2094558 RepID=A0A314XR50_PRUYE|nr:hypothetical protein Pyn_04109 [Prunus yedoensis var. nudiflora]
MTWQLDEDEGTRYDDPNVVEFMWLSTLVTSMARMTAFTMAGVMAPTITRMVTAYHGRSDGRYRGLNDGRCHCRNGDCLPRHEWQSISVSRMTTLPRGRSDGPCAFHVLSDGRLLWPE